MKKTLAISIIILILTLFSCKEVPIKNNAEKNTKTTETISSMTEKTIPTSTTSLTTKIITHIITNAIKNKSTTTVKRTKKKIDKIVFEPMNTTALRTNNTVTQKLDYAITNPIPTQISATKRKAVDDAFNEFVALKNKLSRLAFTDITFSFEYYNEDHKLERFTYGLSYQIDNTKITYNLRFLSNIDGTGEKLTTYYFDGTDIYKCIYDAEKINVSDMENEIGCTVDDILESFKYDGFYNSKDFINFTTYSGGGNSNDPLYNLMFVADKGQIAKQTNENVSKQLNVNVSKVQTYVSRAEFQQTSKSKINFNTYGYEEVYNLFCYCNGYQYEIYGINTSSYFTDDNLRNITPDWYKDIIK